MRKIVVLLLLSILFVFGFSRGGGGFLLLYTFPGVFDLPDELAMDEPFFATGGYGVGFLKDTNLVIGGMGAGAEIDKDGYEYSFGIGGFLLEYRWNLGFVSSNLGLVLGGVGASVGKVVEGGNTVEDFQAGSSSGILSIERDGLTIMPMLSFSVRPLEWLEVVLGVSGVVSYFPEGWRFESGEALSDYSPSPFGYGYSVFLGVSWGS